MTEKEAQDIILGKPLKEVWLPRIEKALEDKRNLMLFSGRFECDIGMNTMAVVILLPMEERWPR